MTILLSGTHSVPLNEALRNKKLGESPSTHIPVPDVVYAADFALSADEELEALAVGSRAEWAAAVWLIYGCRLRIGEALAVRTRYRINKGTTLQVRGQVNLTAQLKPLKFRVEALRHPAAVPQRAQRERFCPVPQRRAEQLRQAREAARAALLVGLHPDARQRTTQRPGQAPDAMAF